MFIAIIQTPPCAVRRSGNRASLLHARPPAPPNAPEVSVMANIQPLAGLKKLKLGYQSIAEHAVGVAPSRRNNNESNKFERSFPGTGVQSLA